MEYPTSGPCCPATYKAARPSACCPPPCTTPGDPGWPHPRSQMRRSQRLHSGRSTVKVLLPSPPTLEHAPTSRSRLHPMPQRPPTSSRGRLLLGRPRLQEQLTSPTGSLKQRNTGVLSRGRVRQRSAGPHCLMMPPSRHAHKVVPALRPMSHPTGGTSSCSSGRAPLALPLRPMSHTHSSSRRARRPLPPPPTHSSPR